MNQIERILEFLTDCDLHLWSDATHEIDTEGIKHLVKSLVEQLDLGLRINAYYYQEWQHWVIVFRWYTSHGLRAGIDYVITLENLERYRRSGVSNLVATDVSDRIRRLSISGNQTWIITRREERILVRVYQGAKRIFFYASEVTQEFDFGGKKSLIIEASLPSWRVAIREDGSIELGGTLLQAELLEWLGVGDDCHIRFSVNAHQLQSSDDSGDFRLQFFTSPGTARLASVERISRMFEQGQIMLPPRGYFDQFLIVLEGRDPDGYAVREALVAVTRPNAINAIGDVSCEYNAKSKYLRCTVNPCGPCEGCQHYEKI